MPETELKSLPGQPDCAPLIALFDQCFARSLNTRLVRGFDEPVYLPATAACLSHQVIFAHGFFSSALHEIAHWCLAGRQRRQQIDYGYWYAPDGRSVQQQQDFEVVEVKPQALEWILSKSCGHRFSVSADNLSGEATDPQAFKLAVYKQVENYCRQGLPARAETLRQALAGYYGVHSKLAFSSYSLTEL
jgi:elongation factor P hydroxylase